MPLITIRLLAIMVVITIMEHGILILRLDSKQIGKWTNVPLDALLSITLAGVKALESGAREAVTLREKPALYDA